MAHSLPSPPLHSPLAAPPPPPPLPPPPLHDHDTTLTLALAPQPFAWALPPSPRPPHARRPPRLDGGGTAPFARLRSSPTGDTPPCTECGKRFLSWKALFGHMRCHPERQWRGITPPPHFRLGGVLDQFTLQEREVATSLLMLAGARPPGGAGGKGKKSLLLGSASSSAPASGGDEYKCSVCHKGFASGRALGGHKRLHWEGAGAVEVAVAAATSSTSRCSVSQEDTAAATATAALDLNLAPPGPPLPRTTTNNDRGGSVNTMLDLKLGY